MSCRTEKSQVGTDATGGSCIGSFCDGYVDDDDDDGLADSLLDISRPLLVGRSVGRVVDGRYRGSTVSYRAKRVSCGRCCCYSTFVAFSIRQDFVSLSRDSERDRENVFLSGTPTREEVVSYTMDGQTASHAGLLIASPRAPVQFPPQDRYGFLRNGSRRISET